MLHIWGPDFSGRAEVNWAVIAFTVEFGAARSAGPTPIGWDRFRAAFLPDSASKVCTIRVTGGLVDASGGVPVVNPAQLALAITSVIPEPEPGGAALGIAPMNLASLTGTALRWWVFGGRVDHGDAPASGDQVGDRFTATPTTTRFPSALWGTTMTRGLGDEPVLARNGVRLTLDPTRIVHPTQTRPVDRAQLTDNAPAGTAVVEVPSAGSIVFEDAAGPDALDPGLGALFGGVSPKADPGLPWDAVRRRRVTEVGG